MSRVKDHRRLVGGRWSLTLAMPANHNPLPSTARSSSTSHREKLCMTSLTPFAISPDSARLAISYARSARHWCARRFARTCHAPRSVYWAVATLHRRLRFGFATDTYDSEGRRKVRTPPRRSTAPRSKNLPTNASAFSPRCADLSAKKIHGRPHTNSPGKKTSPWELKAVEVEVFEIPAHW